MLNISMLISYPVLTLVSTIGKKSFANMGRLIKRSGHSIRRMLNTVSESFYLSGKIAQSLFSNHKHLFLSIDDTLIKKMYAKNMQGAGMFFDTQIGRRIMAFRLVIGVVTDGKLAIPIGCSYLFSRELLDLLTEQKFPTKVGIAKAMIKTARNLFPSMKITVVADGLYSTVIFLKWCNENNVRLEARMHSNRVIIYKEKKYKIKDLLQEKGIRPKGRQMARTISITWHGMSLELTIVRRIDKNRKESIVFQIATYKGLPREHVANYKKRWPVEKINRTTKQFIGLQECFSPDLETQHKHVASVLLAYSLTQLEMKKNRLKTPEDVIRRCKTKNVNLLNQRFVRVLQQKVYAHG